MCDENERCCGCHSHSANPSVQQTLDELDFTRGIWTAALGGSYDDVLTCLKDRNISVDLTDSSGYTALHYASRSGHIVICRLLLDHKASPNIQTRSGGVTPLHRAAYCGYRHIVQLLLQHGADPCLADSDGKLPLHKASEKGHKQVVEILLRQAPDSVLHKDNRDQTPSDCVPDEFSDIKCLLELG